MTGAPRSTFHHAGTLALALLALLIAAGGAIMLSDAASGRGPEGAVRAPESSPASVALAGALRLALAAVGLAAVHARSRKRRAARSLLRLFGAGLAAVSLAEPLLLGIPHGWPAAAGLALGGLAFAGGLRRPRAQ